MKNVRALNPSNAKEQNRDIRKMGGLATRGGRERVRVRPKGK